MPAILSPIEGLKYPPSERAAAYFAAGAWVDSTVGDALRATAKRYPNRAAFASDERTITFAELDDATERLGAALLGLGLNCGDRAMFQMGTTIETAIALAACFKAGIVPVCSLPQHREIEIGQLTRQSGARAYFVQADFGSFDLVAFARRMIDELPTLRHLVVARGDRGPGSLEALIAAMPIEAARAHLADVPLGPQDALSFQLSGGTTGIPKMIPRFHAEYLGHSAGWMKTYRITGDSRLIWSLPLLHNAGQLFALIPTLAMGTTTVLMPRVDVCRMLELTEAQRVTHALSIGPIAPQMMAYTDIARHDLSSLQLFATMSRADGLEAHIGVPCSNLYGITEGLLLGSPADAPSSRRHQTHGASGCALDEIRLLVPETETEVAPGHMGELCFRGPSSLQAFFAASEANAKDFTRDGFYRTGDMVSAHVIEGVTCYAFEGRLRDNVNRGGEKIGCEEVEGVASRHPAVADAKLVAMPDPFYGEKGCIYLIVRPGQNAPDIKALGTFLGSQGLAKYKWPEMVVFDEVLRNVTGKIDKPRMRKKHIESN